MIYEVRVVGRVPEVKRPICQAGWSWSTQGGGGFQFFLDSNYKGIKSFLAIMVFIKFKKSWHVKVHYFMHFQFRTEALLMEGTDAFNCIL